MKADNSEQMRTQADGAEQIGHARMLEACRGGRLPKRAATGFSLYRSFFEWLHAAILRWPACSISMLRSIILRAWERSQCEAW